MNQKLLGGLAAAFMISGLGVMPSSYADPPKPADEPASEQVPESGVSARIASASAPNAASAVAPSSEPAAPVDGLSADPGVKVSSPSESPSAVATTSAPAVSAPALIQPEAAPTPDPVKVGEYQSQENASATVATIQPHQLRGRSAATLYVRNIPVLTFLGDSASQSSSAPSVAPISARDEVPGAEVKVASVQTATGAAASPLVEPATPVPSDGGTPEDSTDPVWRATATAARLNQLYRDSVNAESIKIAWDTDHKQYVIRAGDVEVIVLDSDTVLPDTVGSTANDVLQATNRIRRQMGNASPLASIEGDPNGYREVNLGPISLRASGYASWYGPGFDGNYSASGEVFNAQALTAAHPSLPFGTRVRVTNLDNGQSVVVRINDRGPYSHGRIIDLSAGAAQVIGLVASGVAPVSLEVLGAATASQ